MASNSTAPLISFGTDSPASQTEDGAASLVTGTSLSSFDPITLTAATAAPGPLAVQSIIADPPRDPVFGPEPEILNADAIDQIQGKYKPKEPALDDIEDVDFEPSDFELNCEHAPQLQMFAFSAVFVLVVLAITALGVGPVFDGRFCSSLMFAAIMFEVAVRVPRPPKLPVHLAKFLPGPRETKHYALYGAVIFIVAVSVGLTWGLDKRARVISFCTGGLVLVVGDMLLFLVAEQQAEMVCTGLLSMLLFLLVITLHFDGLKADQDIGTVFAVVVGAVHVPYVVRVTLRRDEQHHRISSASMQRLSDNGTMDDAILS